MLQDSGMIEEGKFGYLWEFCKSPKQSSYIYAMCAGEYFQINNDSMEAKDQVTDMRIFVRHSKAKQVPSDLIF